MWKRRKIGGHFDFDRLCAHRFKWYYSGMIESCRGIVVQSFVEETQMFSIFMNHFHVMINIVGHLGKPRIT